MNQHIKNSHLFNSHRQNNIIYNKIIVLGKTPYYSIHLKTSSSPQLAIFLNFLHLQCIHKYILWFEAFIQVEVDYLE